MRRLIFIVCSAASVLTPGPLLAAGPVKSHRDFYAEANAAQARKDYAAAREGYAAAVALRPDSPQYLHHLAAAAARSGETALALDSLRRLAALGIAAPVKLDADFASLQGTPEFLKILNQLTANRAPQGAAEVLAELPGRTSIIEGIAFRDPTGDLFLGDVHQRCIWRRDRTGELTRFTAEDDELLGVFGLALDEKRTALWAATSAVPEMSGYTAGQKGQAALAEFDLPTGRLRRVVPVPGDGRDHMLGDLLVAPDGTIYATDSAAPIVWQLARGDDEMTKLVESPVFVSLQGLTLGARVLLVSDYANGLFTIDPSTATVQALVPPPNVTLVGLDAFVPVAGGIVAIQNGVEPQRVVRVSLSPDLKSVTGLSVLAAALPQLADLSLITLVNGQPAFIAGAGWGGFDPAKSAHPSAHTVRIFQVALP